MNCKAILIVISILFVSAFAQATVTKNLGQVGTTYPVVEPDILAELKQQAAHKGELSKKQMLDRMRNYQPAALHSLPSAKADKKFLVDMTYTLDRDLTDADGKILYPRGYTFNPLDYITVPGGMVIIDGDAFEQVEWFMNTPYVDNHRVRLLLSGGHAYDLVEKLQRPVFYLTDALARRLQLRAVPSLVIRHGDKMQVQEFHLPTDNQGKLHDKK